MELQTTASLTETASPSRGTYNEHMNYFQAVALAVVEGLTEFLPVSSTGHLVLASDLLKIPQTEFVKSFEIIIQLGAILAVVVLYWRKLFANLSTWKQLSAAFFPTAILGFVFYRTIKDVLLGNLIVTLTALLVGGVILIVLEKLHSRKPAPMIISTDQLSVKQSLLIGIAQSLSMIPGVSRAAATIAGGMLVGADRKTAVEFSFLLAVPTMAAATGLEVIKSNFAFSGQELGVLSLGFVGSFVVALLVVKYFLIFAGRYSLVLFGAYRIFLALLFWLWAKI